MSMYSDYKVGAMNELEFHNECVKENRRDRYEYEHEFDDESDEDEEDSYADYRNDPSRY